VVTVQAAWARLKKLQAFAKMREIDFRPIVYAQLFANLASAATSAATAINFPGGAVILGITSSGYLTGVAISAQGNRNRQSYGLAFSYTNQESLTPGGPISADALLGGGESNLFPPRELVISPNQAITCQVANFTNATLQVHVAYHCLIYKYGS
jgi:hypothetical protein